MIIGDIICIHDRKEGNGDNNNFAEEADDNLYFFFLYRFFNVLRFASYQ